MIRRLLSFLRPATTESEIEKCWNSIVDAENDCVMLFDTEKARALVTRLSGLWGSTPDGLRVTQITAIHGEGDDLRTEIFYSLDGNLECVVSYRGREASYMDKKLGAVSAPIRNRTRRTKSNSPQHEWTSVEDSFRRYAALETTKRK